MTTAVYTAGPPTPPRILHDNGFLDSFRPRTATSEDWLRLSAWVALLELGEAIQKMPFLPHNDLSDGLAAYRHFLFGQGKARTFSYERYVSGDPSGQTTLQNAIQDACVGAEQIYRRADTKRLPVQFQMKGTAIACGASGSKTEPRFPYPATENWQKAIGAHFIWLSATVDVSSGSQGFFPGCVVPWSVPVGPFLAGPVPAAPLFQMVVTLHAEDRYNFIPRAHDLATKLPDDWNGGFEPTGLAKQYMNYSELVRVVRWCEGATTSAVSTSSDTDRQRQPQDNRRVRNKL